MKREKNNSEIWRAERKPRKKGGLQTEGGRGRQGQGKGVWGSQSMRAASLAHLGLGPSDLGTTVSVHSARKSEWK